jgi:hypothetical protein
VVNVGSGIFRGVTTGCVVPIFLQGNHERLNVVFLTFVHLKLVNVE